jgi:hypothetical protein
MIEIEGSWRVRRWSALRAAKEEVRHRFEVNDAHTDHCHFG